MKLLYQKLTEHLLQYLPLSYQPNFYSWLTQGKMINNGGDITDSGIEICQMEYDAVLWFEALPFKEIEPLKLLTLVNVWTAHNDPKYLELNHEIDFEITPIDDTVVDVTLTVKFRESIYGVEDKQGDIHTHNSRYQFGDVQIFDWSHLPPPLKQRARFINDRRQH